MPEPAAGSRPAIEVFVPALAHAPPFTLRLLCAEDRDEYVRAVSLSRADLDRTCPLHLPDETDAALFERHLRYALEGERSGRAWRRVVELEDGRLAGGFSVNNIRRGLDFAGTAHAWVASDATGRGIGTAGLKALVAHAFAEPPAGLGLLRLEAWISRDNDASVRIAQLAGFVRTGEERSYIPTGERWVLHDFFVASAPP
jgi:ribosomal-protein-alanine N-acetyltransferase